MSVGRILYIYFSPNVLNFSTVEIWVCFVLFFSRSISLLVLEMSIKKIGIHQYRFLMFEWKSSLFKSLCRNKAKKGKKNKWGLYEMRTKVQAGCHQFTSCNYCCFFTTVEKFEGLISVVLMWLFYRHALLSALAFAHNGFVDSYLSCFPAIWESLHPSI